jgi:hypothetical protein
MKKLAILFAGLFIMAISVQNVNAQTNPTASDEATASAVIITPIDIAKEADLAFGNIIASASAGTVTVDFANGRTQSGGATFPSVLGTITSAQFKVTGLGGVAYTITLPADEEVKLTGAGADMNLTDFAHNATEVLDGIGEETFQVGATLQVNGNQAAGTYTGQFDAIVNYN